MFGPVFVRQVKIEIKYVKRGVLRQYSIYHGSRGHFKIFITMFKTFKPIYRHRNCMIFALTTTSARESWRPSLSGKPHCMLMNTRTVATMGHTHTSQTLASDLEMCSYFTVYAVMTKIFSIYDNQHLVKTS